MNVKSLDAIEGWNIWKKSWDFSKPRWFHLFVVTVTTLLLTIAVSLIPIFGPAISTALTGVLSFGLMCVTSEIQKTGKVDFKILFAGFDNGVIQRLYTLIFIWVIAGVVQGILMLFSKAIPYGEYLKILVSLSFSALIISFIIFAPALIIWYDLPTKEAINLNFEAAKKNMPALLVYTLAPAAVLFVPVLFMLISIQLLPQMFAAIMSALMLLVMFGTIMVFCPAMVASLYFLFEAIFLSEAPLAAPEAEDQPPQQ